MSIFATILSYFLVGILWGCTNPFIKHASNVLQKKKKLLISSSNASLGTLDIEKQLSTSSHTSQWNQRLDRWFGVFLEPSVYIPLIINQCGSLIFYTILFKEPISIASPVCNSLTFIFTALTGYFIFREEVQYPMFLCIGIGLVLLGIYICIRSQEAIIVSNVLS